MKSTFRDLQASESVSTQDLRDTLEDYAVTGAAIKGRVVIEVINKTSLTNDMALVLLTSVQKGIEVHIRRGELIEANEYKMVESHLMSCYSLSEISSDIANRKIRIIVTKRGWEDFEVRLSPAEKYSRLAGFGKTVENAIGDWMKNHCKVLGIEIEYKEQ